MTEQLKEAIDLAIQKLPDKEHNMIARYILSLLETYEKENIACKDDQTRKMDLGTGKE